jgi:hypothetical protein
MHATKDTTITLESFVKVARQQWEYYGNSPKDYPESVRDRRTTRANAVWHMLDIVMIKNGINSPTAWELVTGEKELE